MASFKQDVALAAARTRILAERLPADRRDALIVEWGEALDALGAAPTMREMEAVLTHYRARVEARLAR